MGFGPQRITKKLSSNKPRSQQTSSFFSISNWPPVWGLKDVELFVKYGKEVVCFEEVSGGKYL